MAIVIGASRVSIYLEESFSLKDKRHVVRSLIKRTSNQFNVAIAEVEDLDDLRVATIAFAVLSNDSRHADEMLASINHFLEKNLELGVIGEIETELIHL